MFNARDNQFKVHVDGAKPKLVVVLVESVKASLIKDAGTVCAVTAITLFMMMMGLSMTMGLALFAIFMATIVLPRLIDGPMKTHRLPPAAAIDFIEQELAEAVAEAKEKGDLL